MRKSKNNLTQVPADGIEWYKSHHLWMIQTSNDFIPGGIKTNSPFEAYNLHDFWYWWMKQYNFKFIWYLRYGLGSFLSVSTMAHIIPMGSLSKGLNCGFTLNWTGPQLMSARFEGLSFYYLLGAFWNRIFSWGTWYPGCFRTGRK